jgi:hypothetical protein
MTYYVFDNGEAMEASHEIKDAKAVSKAVYLKARAEYAKKRLLTMISPKDTIYCVLKHRAPSGMSRSIEFLITWSKDGKTGIQSITHYMADLGWKFDQTHGGLRIGGCGMDAGFGAVYSLGRILWTNGTDKPHGVRNGEPDSDGGYAIGHSWL